MRAMRRLVIASTVVLLSTQPALAGTLSCSITTAGACSGTVIWRMTATTNAHAELASQSTAAYANNVVCCTGVSGMGTSCSGTFATALKLSGTTNGHAEQNSFSNYANSACISVPSGGSVSIGYQSTNCTGFDTTLGSMSATTNAHTGNTTAYTTKICGTATAPAGSLSIDIVDAGGTTVGSPSMVMTPITVSIPFQTATGSFGTSSQKIRVTNTTQTATWTASVAASATTAFWDSTGTDYDFNDATASAGDGGDADSLGGRMTVDASGSTITPQGGCATTGLTKGSSTGYNEGTTNSVTLVTAGGTAQLNCYWDITGVSISQTIPPGQPAASDYDINMVLSVL